MMQGRQAVPADFGADGALPAEFTLLVAEAFDRGVTLGEWRAWTRVGSDPKLREALIGIWDADVWPQFVAAFGLVR